MRGVNYFICYVPMKTIERFTRIIIVRNDMLPYTIPEAGKLDHAVVSHQRALDIKPDDAEAHSNLGHALQDLGKLDDAVTNYRKGLAIKPDYAEALYGLGDALLKKGQHKEGLKYKREGKGVIEIGGEQSQQFRVLSRTLRGANR